MFYFPWSEIIKSICCDKVEYIDKEKILNMLEIRYDYDSEVIDKLYDLKAITIDEYIKYMEKVVLQDEVRMKCDIERINKAREEREKFDPMVYYGVSGYKVI